MGVDFAHRYGAIVTPGSQSTVLEWIHWSFLAVRDSQTAQAVIPSAADASTRSRLFLIGSFRSSPSLCRLEGLTKTTATRLLRGSSVQVLPRAFLLLSQRLH